MLIAQLCLTLYNGLQPTRPLCPWSSPGKNIGVGCKPLQYSCQENHMNRRAWWATVRWVSKSQKGLRDWALRHTFVYIPSLFNFSYLLTSSTLTFMHIFSVFILMIWVTACTSVFKNMCRNNCRYWWYLQIPPPDPQLFYFLCIGIIVFGAIAADGSQVTSIIYQWIEWQGSEPFSDLGI